LSDVTEERGGIAILEEDRVGWEAEEDRVRKAM